MLPKRLISQARLLRGAKPLVPRRFLNGDSGKFCDGGTHATMNDLPIPVGDWYEHFHRRNTRYNLIMYSGILSFIGSVFLFFTSPNVTLNYSVPEYED